MEVRAGDFVTLAARRDRRIFLVAALMGNDRALIRCPCCSISSHVLLNDLRWIHPLEARERLEAAPEELIAHPERFPV